MYSGVMFTPDAPAVLGQDFRGGTAVIPGPIPLEEMRQWQAGTVERIQQLNPRRVLEIGVGSGVVVGSAGSGVCGVLGTDFSAPTIENLQAAVAEQSWGDRVRLRVQPADVAEGCRRPFRCGGP